MDSLIKKIQCLAQINVGSEDDLIAKIILPFFCILGYDDTRFELKYPVPCYRPNRVGRKPEADCVFFFVF